MSRVATHAEGAVAPTDLVSPVATRDEPRGARPLSRALERDAKATLGPVLDLRPVALELRDRAADVEAGRVGGAEDELAGLAQAEGHGVDAVDAGERLPEAGDRPEAAQALDDH